MSLKVSSLCSILRKWRWSSGDKWMDRMQRRITWTQMREWQIIVKGVTSGFASGLMTLKFGRSYRRAMHYFSTFKSLFGHWLCRSSDLPKFSFEMERKFGTLLECHKSQMSTIKPLKQAKFCLIMSMVRWRIFMWTYKLTVINSLINWPCVTKPQRQVVQGILIKIFYDN